ncbi:uncharacterized protein LOC107270801 [Cephus cinctus]|uniref:Uncharacterized protein LOC107270801 n=1 Tax=Cephus cinctus TaxID=211228 RepID=A0AAJ7C512_CEPCN|nr:uncharacterized protein LOC107270801 [Cephus cinctus]
MEEVEQSTKISETPHGVINSSNRSSRSSYDSADSGYLTLTPHSGAYTPIVSGCRGRVSCTSSKRHHRIRTDPWQSICSPRYRSRLSRLLNTSESVCDSLIDESAEIHSPILKSSVQSCEHQSSSLDQHDLALESQNLSSDLRDFRELRRAIRRDSCTTAPITPASRLQLLSPPPSPAVPSSSFIASEPIEEDVEMKLVIVPQSTPHVTSSPRRSTPPPRITFSPTTSKASLGVTSADNKKLSKLMITDLATTDIKPKRLDFSQRALSVALHRTRATPDYTGKDTVDVLLLLGEKSDHWRIVSKILALLSPQDLCSISMVSKAWRRICANDSRANTRRLSHIILRQSAKENLKLFRKAKMESDIQTSPKSRYARKGYLLEVQNLLQVPPTRRPPNSPPVSPSKVKFHSFVKASRTLAPWEHLLPCPRCSFPCHVDGEKNVGTCSRQGCSMEFCTSCSSRPHTGPCKTPLLATPTKRNKRLIVGSRQSKRNLRRL